MKLKLFLSAVIASAAFAACSSGGEDEPETTTPTNPADRKIIIKVGENPFLDENGSARETRGAIITTQSLQDFKMHWNKDADVYSDYNVRRGTDDKWIPTPTNTDATIGTNTWPASVGNDEKISFYAHTNTTGLQGNAVYNFNNGEPYVSFNDEEASADQNDLLLSKMVNVSYNNTNGEKGVIWFTFDHACAAVDFNIQITNKLYTTTLQNTNLTVNSVKLMNVAKTGDCYYSSGSGNHIGEWKNVGNHWGDETSGYTNYTLTKSEAITVSTTPTALPCNSMFIIPQTLGEDAKLEIKYTLSGTEKTCYILMSGTTWAAGYRYTINIALGTTLIQDP